MCVLNLQGYVVTSNKEGRPDSYYVLFHFGDVLNVIGLTYSFVATLNCNEIASREPAEKEVYHYLYDIVNGTDKGAAIQRILAKSYYYFYDEDLIPGPFRSKNVG